VPNASNIAEVEAIKGRLDGSVAALLTEYRGLKVAELGELRASLRGSSTEYRVLKNTLTSIWSGCSRARPRSPSSMATRSRRPRTWPSSPAPIRP